MKQSASSAKSPRITVAKSGENKPSHFLDLKDIPQHALREILSQARTLKSARQDKKRNPILEGRTLGMIFEKNSTRTRVSFEVAMFELGGHALYLSSKDLQLGRGETIADTARVLSRYVDAIMLRANSHETLSELAYYATVPVINGLTDMAHPCQVMADILTIEERRGDIASKTVAWVGDGNNMANSWIAAAAQFGFNLRVACPKQLQPHQDYIDLVKERKAPVKFVKTAEDAVRDADVVVTDTWVSMGQEDTEARKKLLAPYQVNEALMALTSKDAIFLHCLPAHRGEEVTGGVIDGEQSAVWDEAENRLHVQKAIILWCLQG